MDRYAKPYPGASPRGRREPGPENRLEQLLREARQEFLSSGEPMLDWDGVNREIAARRGGVGEDD